MNSPNGFFQPNAPLEQSNSGDKVKVDSNNHEPTPNKKPNWFKRHPILATSFGLLTFGIIIGLVTAIILNGGLQNFTKTVADTIKQTVVDSSIKAYAEELSLEPVTQDSLGVASDSRYILKSKNPLTKGQITNNLTTDPQVDLVVTEVSTTEFEIQTKNPIEIGTVQKFGLKIENDAQSEAAKNLSWAFAIKNEFKIISVLPRNKATNVPVTSAIEIEFSSSAYQSLDNFFSIKPDVKGQFKKYNNRTAFVPDKLLPATLYTVTLKQGLKLEGSIEVLNQDFSWQFETTQALDNNRLDNIFERSFFEFAENQKPSLTVIGEVGQILDSSLYRFNDLGQFLDYLKQRQARPYWSIFSQKNETYDLVKLQKVLDAKLPIKQANSVNYIDYPQNLEKGYYLAVLPNKDTAVIQITNNSGYLSSSKTKTIIWANDLATKKALNIAQIKDLDNNQIAVTGDDGVALFNTPDFAKSLDKENYYQLVTPQFTSVIPIVNSVRNNPIESFRLPNGSNDNYWNYISTDRSIYRASDNTNFWGLLKSRNNSDLKQVRAELITYNDLLNFDNESVLVQQKTINISPIGTFIDNFKFDELKSGSYEIRLYEPKTNELLLTKNLSIQEFTKPVYNISLRPETEPYLKNQTISFVGKVEFYDGSPVQKLVLNYSGDATGETTTDQNGEFKISYLAANKNTESYQLVQSSYINVQPKVFEEAEIIATGFVGFFPYNTAIKNETKIESGKGVANLNYTQLDASRYTDSNQIYYTDFSGKAIENLAVKATIIGYVYDKIPSGTNYNPITKESEILYNYVRRDVSNSTQNLVTNSQGNIQASFDLLPQTEYQLYFDSKENDGQDIRFNTYLNSISDVATNLDYYTLNEKATAANITEGYSIGQPVNLEVFKNNSIDQAAATDKYLLVKSSNGILDYTLENKPVLNFNFEEKYVPNININGVKFDGNNYNNIENFGKSINFKSDDKKLNLEIKTDKESYAPGEKVKLSIFSKDKDGKPKPTKVNLAVIDESLRYLDPIDANPQELYKNVGTGINQIYTSHSSMRLAANEFGGMGNGGEGARSNFLDTAYFNEIETNQEGLGSAEFTLPDNVTSWRITAQSFSSDLFFGVAVKKIAATKPIVASTILSPTYLENDQPTILLRASGLNLDPNKEANFKLEIPKISFTETKKGSASGVKFDLEALKIGQYKLKITASLDDVSDTIERSFEVKSSYQNYNTAVNVEVKNPLVLDNNLPSGQVITATFGGKVLTQNYAELQNLLNQNGNRLDQIIAANKSQKLLNQYFKQGLAENDFDYSNYQNLDDNGLQLLPYSSSDLGLTTMVLLASPNEFNNPKIESYYNNLITSQNLNLNQLSLVLLGQSLLKKPVLNDVKLLLAKPDLDLATKLNLALASLTLGDTEAARKVFSESVLNKLQSDQNGKFIPADNLENTLKLSSLGSILAIKLGFKEGYDLHNYVVKSTNKTDLYNLEQVIFLTDYLAQNKSNPINFSYSLNNENKNINLEAGQIHQILVTKEQLANLNLNTDNSDLYLTLNYQSSLLNQKPDSDIKLTRSYLVENKPVNTFNLGQIVTVNLKIDLAPGTVLDGCYIVKDYLPAGLKPLTNSFIAPFNTKIEINYPYQIEGQELSFCYSPDFFKNNNINYLARVVQAGQFSSDSSIIQAGNNFNVFNTAAKQVVKIN